MEAWRMEMLIPTLSVLMMSTPFIVVWVIGAAMALSRWRRHPRVSQFALIAFVLMIIKDVAGAFLRIFLPLTMRDNGWTNAQIGAISIGTGVATSLISAVSWALVLCAIFGWRGGIQKQDFFPPAPPAFSDEPRGQNTTS
jgi:hypothetical protein